MDLRLCLAYNRHLIKIICYYYANLLKRQVTQTLLVGVWIGMVFTGKNLVIPIFKKGTNFNLVLPLLRIYPIGIYICMK